MARTTTRQSRPEREAAILAAARSEFEANGFDKAKMADIASKVGIVEGTIFHYFGSKRGLMMAVMQAFYAEITGSLLAGLRDVRGTRNQLHFVIRHHLGVMSDNAALCGVILRQSRGLSGELKDAIHGFNREYTSPLIDIIEAGIESGELRDSANPAMLRNTIYGSIEHALWVHLAEGQPIDPDAYAEDLLRVVIDGLNAGTKDLTKREVATLVRKLDRLVE